MTTTLQKVGIWVMAIAAAAFIGSTMMPITSHAAKIDTGLGDFQDATQLGEEDLKKTIGEIVKVVLGFLGIIAVLIVLWAGFLWMTATGNEDQITKAKGILVGGLIGLLIVLSAYAITKFVLDEFGQASGTEFNF